MAQKMRDPSVLRAQGCINAGERHLQASRFPAAILSFKDAVELNPQNPLAHYGLGRTYAELGNQQFESCDWEKAIPHYNAAIASLYMARGLETSTEKRRGLEEELSVIHSNAGLAYYNMVSGIGPMSRERSGPAQEFLRVALQLDPQNSLALENLCKICAAVGDLQEAARLWSKLQSLQEAEMRMAPPQQGHAMYV